ncbi:hypothetical protein [Alkalihalobacillus pseudalcaliphilus]|uniref:hypothetical protein n=1 Tax=Alkalihalobacillus pseudalcaliphilus TaxID=79884 RepID=UPI00064DA5F7|nr:hypothetical protein [Alkalihalobacillus pseudalcaliphilus]KMK74491.1 hypothetical protein AB990_20390 [Alkalihalobacillus pseudalcaliphilus]
MKVALKVMYSSSKIAPGMGARTLRRALSYLAYASVSIACPFLLQESALIPSATVDAGFSVSDLLIQKNDLNNNERPIDKEAKPN